LSAQGIKSRIQEIQATEDRLDDALPEAQARARPKGHGKSQARAALAGPRFHGPLGARVPALRATGHPLGPLSPGAYKYPLVSEEGISREESCILLLC